HRVERATAVRVIGLRADPRTERGEHFLVAAELVTGHALLALQLRQLVVRGVVRLGDLLGGGVKRRDPRLHLPEGQLWGRGRRDRRAGDSGDGGERTDNREASRATAQRAQTQGQGKRTSSSRHGGGSPSSSTAYRVS